MRKATLPDSLQQSWSDDINRLLIPKPHFLDLHLSISNGFVSSKIYDKRDDFDFDMVNFPFLDGDVLRSTSYLFLNLFGLLECLVMWFISMPVIKAELPNFSNRAIGIINFERLSPNVIADTMNWFLNSVLD